MIKLIFAGQYQIKSKNKRHKAVLESQTQTKNKKVLPKNETVFRPRYWDRDIIKKIEKSLNKFLLDGLKITLLK